MSVTWSDFTKQVRKYLSNSDQQIINILRKKFFQTTSEFQKTEVSKPIFDKCIADIAFNPDRIYVILNDLKTTFKLHTPKIDKQCQPSITKRRLDFQTITQDSLADDESPHIKSHDSSNHRSDNHIGDDDDDDVIIIDPPSSSNNKKPLSNPIQSSFDSSKNSISENDEPKEKYARRNDEDFGDAQNDKRYRIICRLEHLMTRLSQAIRELEEKELDLDELDSSNSPYLKLDVLKRQYLQAWRRHCELRNVARKSGRILRRRFTYNGCQYPKVNEKIEEIVNQKRLFPDWTDIYRIVTTVNKEEQLNLPGSAVKSLAREIFIDVGHSLKQRRQDDLRHDFGCHLTDDLCDDDDPTYSSRDLRRKLTENKRLGDDNLNKVFKHYIDLQHTIQTVQQIIEDPECSTKVENHVTPQSDVMNSNEEASVSNAACFSTDTEQCESDKPLNSPATSDEVFTLSSDSDENESAKLSPNISNSVNSASMIGVDEFTPTVNVSQGSIVKNYRRNETIKNDIVASNTSIDVPVTCSSVAAASPSPPAPPPTTTTTTIDLLDDDISLPPTSCSTSILREQRPKWKNPPHLMHNNNHHFTFSTPIIQETRQSSQVLTVATRYDAYRCDTFSQMASAAHIIHGYPVSTNTTALITNKIHKQSSRHFVNNSYKCSSIVHMNSCSSTFAPFKIKNIPTATKTKTTTTTTHIPLNNSHFINTTTTTTDTTTTSSSNNIRISSCTSLSRLYNNETIEID
ncbi:unnamed protein product [Schistosoma turkestanicum]|nr:unnamed protein product [Schistosoma turkestanicum]